MHCTKLHCTALYCLYCHYCKFCRFYNYCDYCQYCHYIHYCHHCHYNHYSNHCHYSHCIMTPYKSLIYTFCDKTYLFSYRGKESQDFICLFIIILMLWQSCTESNKKKLSGSNRKQQEWYKASGSIWKLEEVSGSSRKPQEAPWRHNIQIIINKQTKYSGSESKNKI